VRTLTACKALFFVKSMHFSPPHCAFQEVLDRLKADGFAVLDSEAVAQSAQMPRQSLIDLTPAWDQLPPDRFLKDGGRYRRRRHGSFVVSRRGVDPVPHRAHWQPVDYNALHGGIERWFEPLESAMADSPAYRALLVGFARVADRLWPGTPRWYGEAHAFRIDCTDGIGRPTPEGAHRDGVDLVVVLLIGRQAIRGGETRVFDAAGPQGMRFTLDEPWSALLLDDARVIHESTPIQPEQPGQPGWRDTLVLTYRRGGFQDPPSNLTSKSMEVRT
jgi:hypothetical protein